MQSQTIRTEHTDVWFNSMRPTIPGYCGHGMRWTELLAMCSCLRLVTACLLPAAGGTVGAMAEAATLCTLQKRRSAV